MKEMAFFAETEERVEEREEGEGEVLILSVEREVLERREFLEEMEGLGGADRALKEQVGEVILDIFFLRVDTQKKQGSLGTRSRNRQNCHN